MIHYHPEKIPSFRPIWRTKNIKDFLNELSPVLLRHLKLFLSTAEIQRDIDNEDYYMIFRGWDGEHLVLLHFFHLLDIDALKGLDKEEVSYYFGSSRWNEGVFTED